VGSNPSAFMSTLAAFSLGQIIVRTIATVLCERARRATLVAILNTQRQRDSELLLQHSSDSCLLRVRQSSHSGDGSDNALVQ
jgi:hypothetical protein